LRSPMATGIGTVYQLRRNSPIMAHIALFGT
jgi:hypothetical protein